MRWLQKFFSNVLKWVVPLCVLSGAAYGLKLFHDEANEANEDEAAHAQATSDTGAGNIEVDEQQAERLGLEVVAAKGVDWIRRVTVYGRVVPNALATSEIRTACAGILRSSAEATWPVPGQHVASGQVIGAVDVRVGPELRLELQNKLSEARLRQRGEQEVVKVHERTVASLQKVTDREILSRAELDTALVNLAEAKIQLGTAEAAATLWEKSLREFEQQRAEGASLWRQPIIAPAEGIVTELAGRPGMAVEPGTLLLQLVDFRRPLVRLDLPAELLASGNAPREVTLVATLAAAPELLGGSHARDQSEVLVTRPARLIGPGPAVDFSGQRIGVLYDAQPVDDSPANAEVPEVWRPGLQVKAELRPETVAAIPAVAVPVSAVLFHEGRSLVYVRVADDQYQRREVRLLSRDGDHWIVAIAGDESLVGVAVGESVVHRNAQVLLSKEFLKASGDTD